jgi:hypothetical protein
VYRLIPYKISHDFWEILRMKKIFFFLLLAALARQSSAANLAFDDASDPVYTNGWFSGSNGGYGFGAWQLVISGTFA